MFSWISKCRGSPKGLAETFAFARHCLVLRSMGKTSNLTSTHLPEKRQSKAPMDPAAYMTKSANELIEIVDENNQSLNTPMTRGEMR
jgi:hypothetical protein